MKRKVAFIIFLFLLFLIGAAFIIISPTYKQPPPANYPSPKNAAEANLQDLEYLKHLPEIDRSFTPSTKQAFYSAVTKLERQAQSLNSATFEMEIAKAVALSGNGHTNVRDAAWGLTMNSLPLRFSWFAEGLYVVKADPADANLLGAKVVSEGSYTPQQLEQALRVYNGGAESLTRALTPHFLESPEALHAISLLPSSTQATFLFQLQTGQEFRKTIQAQPESVIGLLKDSPELKHPKEYWPSRDLSPIRIPGDNRQWVHLLDHKSPLPLYLRDPETHYWRTYLANSQILYLQINITQNQAGKPPLQTFLKDVINEVTRNKTKDAIIDLRFNPGGNSGLTATFTNDLPKIIPQDGKIFIITSNSTFSAAIITTARLKYFSGTRGYIVGERIGDNEQFWAEGSRMILPNSHLNIVYATAFHDWKYSCSLWQIQTCFFLNYFIGVPAGDLSPTLPAAPRFNDYIAGEDTAFNEIMKKIQK